MPTGVVPVLIGVAVLVTIATALDWLIAHPALLVLMLAAISGGVFFWQKQKRARNRV